MAAMSIPPAGTESGFANMNIGDRAEDVAEAFKFEDQFAEMLAGVNAQFNTGKTKDLAWRKAQLKGIMDLHLENHEARWPCETN